MAEYDHLAHVPVLAEAAVEALLAAGAGAAGAGADAGADADAVFVDATFGGGGHSGLLLARLPAQARLLALDCCEMAAARAARVRRRDFTFARRNYSDLAAALRECGASNARGVLFDLGVSSLQLDCAARGFSFAADAPLDMRLDRRGGISAAEWLAQESEESIGAALRRYGEEPEARRIARALCARRGAIARTAQLAQVVREAKRRPAPPGRHPATRAFMAIRIAVNDELRHLQLGLDAARRALAVGGRLVVIAFHSLEDRMVKRLGQAVTLPGIGRVGGGELRAVGRAQAPSAAEVAANPRARSARLRVFAKVAPSPEDAAAAAGAG